MIQPPVAPRRRRVDPMRSQALLDAGLTVLAIAAALLLLRLLFRLLSIPDRVWSGQTIYALTDPLVFPFALIPGGTRQMAGNAALADITAATLLIVIPLFWLSRARKT